MIALWLALSCPTHALERPAPLPDPLPPHPMRLADPQIGALSNGIEVRVAPNHEVPLFEVRLVFAVGAYADPHGKEGLAGLAFDLLDEGAGDRSAEDIAAELKRLAADVSSWSDTDAGYVVASGLKRNMAEVLDVWADIARRPSFPDEAFDIVRDRRVAELKLQAEDPGAIARTVYRHLVWGDGYIGRSATPETVAALTLDEARDFYAAHAGPDNAILLVGGDVTLAEIQPLLEARLGDWKVDGFQDAPVVAEPLAAEEERIYLVDKPGAPQSIVRGVTLIGTLDDPDVFDLRVASEMFGGSFTGRVNMNLREDKGYTYGAWCGPIYRHGPGIYLCNAAVRADATAASLSELRAEIARVRGDAPLTEDEVARARDSLAYGWPGKFETTGPILDLEFEIWRYGKPEDWAEEYIPKVRAVTTDAANAALFTHLDPRHMSWLIVGDAEVVRPGLEEIGLPIVELDRRGEPVQ